jgi:hypothetical protein
MKLLNILVILFFVFSISICQAHPKAAKKDKESIALQYNIMSGADIRAMVKVQIDSARAREFRGEIKSCMYYDNSSADLIYSNENNIADTKPVIEINPKVLILILFSVSLLIFVFIRRFIRNRKYSDVLPEQESIKIINKEETSKNETDDLENLRNKLNPPIPDIKESSLPGKPKGIKISQGEMILAAKIKSYQLAHFDNK